MTDNLQSQVVQTVVASSSDAVGLLFRAAADCTDSDGSEDEVENRTAAVVTGAEGSVCTSVLSPGLKYRVESDINMHEKPVLLQAMLPASNQASKQASQPASQLAEMAGCPRRRGGGTAMFGMNILLVHPLL